MLNSFEIVKALDDLGLKPFILKGNDKENERIRRYKTPNKQIIYVKTSAEPDVKPVHKSPLLINPTLSHFKDQIDNINGIEVDWLELRKNSNINLFSEDGETLVGEKKSAYAVAVASKSALQQLLCFIDPVTFKPEASLLDEITIAESSLPTDTTTRKTVIDARIGQGRFRDNLINHWGSCAITGAVNTLLLKASHIKPWKDSDNKERLDHFNGLLLSANLDAAFDSGLISFNDDGKIIVSELFDDIADFGISNSMTLRKVYDEHKPYLQHHRDNVFKGTA